MCELLGLSASAPVDVTLSFGHLAAHGGPGGHPDGWGVAFLDGTDARVWRDPYAAATSPWVRCLADNPVTSRLVVAHIRRATRGALQLANTQPFVRELFGRVHVFAHNGNLPDLHSVTPLTHFQPLGETDSELAFCEFLTGIADGDDAPSTIRSAFAQTARRLRDLGPANLLYASGGRLLVHSDRRTQASGAIEPPGLWLLERQCEPVAVGENAPAGIDVRGTALRVAIVASVPLTSEPWHPLARGSILEIVDGEISCQLALDQMP